jgi:hypothetical protein
VEWREGKGELWVKGSWVITYWRNCGKAMQCFILEMWRGTDALEFRGDLAFSALVDESNCPKLDIS